MLQRTLGAHGRTVQIASDGTIAFYILTDDAGQYCLASGKLASSERFGAIGPCRAQPAALLPSAEHPLVADPTVSMDITSGVTTFLSAYGLAADNVVRGAIVDADGAELESASVNDHIFRIGQPASGQPAALIAIDASGNEIARIELLLPSTSSR